MGNYERNYCSNPGRISWVITGTHTRWIFLFFYKIPDAILVGISERIYEKVLKEFLNSGVAGEKL